MLTVRRDWAELGSDRGGGWEWQEVGMRMSKWGWLWKEGVAGGRRMVAGGGAGEWSREAGVPK